MMLINMPQKEMLLIWGELMECYHGKHGFGGDTAEIYSHRCGGHSPCIEVDPESEYSKEEYKRRWNALRALCAVFADVYNCDVIASGFGIDKLGDFVFDHRVHLRVVKKEAPDA